MDRIDSHCREIERCNQRGGRMLSIVDLIEADTVTIDLAAYALAVIGRGASFLTGALPGGAGKTTIMGALLNFIPADVAPTAADGVKTIRRTLDDDRRRCCICHEIGPGPYYAYLWDAELRAYFELLEAGHMLATNLHADTYDQARQQICDQNGVPIERLRQMNVMFFIEMSRAAGRTARRVVEVWESDGRTDHRCLFSPHGESLGDSRLADAEAQAEARAMIEQLVAEGVRTIDAVRRRVVSACGGS